MRPPSNPLAAIRPFGQRPPPDTEGGPESLLPGERSGEGSKDLFKHIQRDIRRRASGVPPVKKKPDDQQP
ncbi:MAG: hypothetical protein JWP22_3260 [Ramlibacter sp.]|nr:hypothetical protein [Ramlibacter sp.]